MHKAKVKALIKNDLVPKLREEGWKGSGFSFRRETNNHTIGLLQIQMNRDGRSFCVEIGVYFTFIESSFVKDLKKVKIQHTDIRKRLTPNNEDDFW